MNAFRAALHLEAQVTTCRQVTIKLYCEALHLAPQDFYSLLMEEMTPEEALLRLNDGSEWQVEDLVRAAARYTF